MERNTKARKVPLLYIVVTILSFFVTFCGNTQDGSPMSGMSETALIIIGGTPDFPHTLVNTSAERIFTLTNIGGKTATQISSDFFLSLSFDFKGGTFPGTDGTCGTALSSGEGCSVVVVFTPHTPGTAQSALSIEYHNGSITKTINDFILSGTGV